MVGALVHSAVLEFFSHQVHRGNLRFCQGLDVAGLRDRDVAVTENRLNFSVRNSERVKVRRESAAESVPASPLREILVLLEQVSFRLMFFPRFFADAAFLDRWLNHAFRQIV